MVEKKSAISYESIMKDLKARKYSPVYVLMGEEPFYIDKICDYISENMLQPEERDFNQTVVFGADAVSYTHVMLPTNREKQTLIHVGR